MDDFESSFPRNVGEIPRELWSAYSEAPFRECTVCGRSLGPNDAYEIQKVSNERETIFEIAICIKCGIETAGEYSEESMTAINGFVSSHLDVSRDPSSCSLCGRELAEARTRAICGVCRGNYLILPVIRVCDRCEGDLQELVSDKTRRAHDDFINRTVPGVPADLDLAPTMFF